jgi:chemotaxis protein CheD
MAEPVKLSSGLEDLKVPVHSYVDSVPRVYVHAGQIHATSAPCEISTIVGSCVAVFLWDEKRGIAGCAHYLLPRWDGEGERTARYGNVALELLLAAMKNNAAAMNGLKAGVYGGGSVLNALRTMSESLGKQNCDTALDVLRASCIPVVQQAVGGNKGRKVVFRTWNAATLLEEI